jgi:hypothetical protein
MGIAVMSVAKPSAGIKNYSLSYYYSTKIVLFVAYSRDPFCATQETGEPAALITSAAYTTKVKIRSESETVRGVNPSPFQRWRTRSPMVPQRR